MPILVWIHVVAMVAAIAVFVGIGTAIRVIARGAEPPVFRSAAALTSPLFRIGGIATGIGIVAGLILARNFGYTAPWLIGAYVLSAAGAGLGIGIDARWAERLAAADDATYQAIRREPLPMISGAATALIWAAILWLMIAKPA